PARSISRFSRSSRASRISLRADGIDALLSRADELCQDKSFREAIWRHCAYRADHIPIDRLNTRIHRNDQMLLHSLNYFHEVNYSLSQYFNIALQQHNAAQQIMRLVFGNRSQDLRILDF